MFIVVRSKLSKRRNMWRLHKTVDLGLKDVQHLRKARGRPERINCYSVKRKLIVGHKKTVPNVQRSTFPDKLNFSFYALAVQAISRRDDRIWLFIFCLSAPSSRTTERQNKSVKNLITLKVRKSSRRRNEKSNCTSAGRWRCDVSWTHQTSS